VDLEKRVPASHPIRKIRQIVDTALAELHDDFEAMYAGTGRPSIPPMLLRALLLQILFTVRSERQLMDRLDFDLLFRWFVGLGVDDSVWDPSTFSKNRDRLLRQEIDELLFQAVRKQAYAKQLLSRDHFTVDGTLLDACASMKSLRPRNPGTNDDQGGGNNNQGVDFHGEKRSNKTHVSGTDGSARTIQDCSADDQEAHACHAGSDSCQVTTPTARVYGRARALAWPCRPGLLQLPRCSRQHTPAVRLSGCPAFGARCAAPGASRFCAAVNADVCHGLDSINWRDTLCHRFGCFTRTCLSALASLPVARAVCGNSARTDLCGGRQTTAVPTATNLIKLIIVSFMALLLHIICFGLVSFRITA